MALPVPANLARAQLGPEFAAWRAALPDTVARFARRWSLRVGPPFSPGGSSAWVAPARTAAGDAVALKLGWRHLEADDEAAGLRAWAGDGVVRLYADHVEDATSGLLLELCRPGGALRQAAEPDQDRIIAELLPRLWSAPIIGTCFRPLQALCDAWAAEALQRPKPAVTVADPGIIRAGAELFRALPASADNAVLLVTDLHAGNVLAAEREPWLMIDPKPYVGDRAFDALQHMLNCDRLLSGPRQLSRQLATLLELDPERLERWLFARCAIESDHDSGLAHVARVLSAS